MMNKRQKKKHTKKQLIKHGYSEDGNAYCIQCGEKLSLSDDWQMKYGACNQTCYGIAIGVYPVY